ncbi:MAG: DUF4179 domain-containing protein [Clostridia bacterium]|nr:DUF4179 domain-containing protein [Clostridia bacterium]
MKNDHEIMDRVRAAVDDCTRGIEETPSLRYRILTQAKGDPPMKKKLSTVLILATVLMLLVTGAVAATLLHGDILGWLFRTDRSEAPAEIAALVETAGESRRNELSALTLNETLFDGNTLSLSLTLENPTDEPMVYRIRQAKLNGQYLIAESVMLPYGSSAGELLGGEADGQVFPKEATVYATFTAVSDYPDPLDNAMGSTAAIAAPEEGSIPSLPSRTALTATDEAEFSVLVEVFRPVDPARLTALGHEAFLDPSSPATGSGSAESRLIPFDSATVPSLLAQIGSEEYTFPIRMKTAAIPTVSAQPGTYENDLFSLELDSFTLSSVSGMLEGCITVPAPSAMKDRLPEDLTFFYAFPEDVYEQAKQDNSVALALRMGNSGGGWSNGPGPDSPILCNVSASFRSNTGSLPRGVYLVWMTGNNGTPDWDTAIYIPLK